MALDRLVPTSASTPPVAGTTYMDAVSEEITGLWDRVPVKLGSVTGTNAITGTPSPALTGSLVDGMMFLLKPANTTTSSTVTLDVGTGAKTVLDRDGAAPAAGSIKSTGTYPLMWSSSANAFLVVSYLPPASSAVGLVLIKTQLVSSPVATVDFVHGTSNVVMDDTYDSYQLVVSNFVPSTDDVEFWLRISTNSGSTYETTTYDYAYSWTTVGGGPTGGSASSAAKIIIGMDTSATGSVGNASSEGISAIITFDNPESTSLHKYFYFNGIYAAAVSTPGRVYGFSGGGGYRATTAVNGIRLMFESGNIATGRATLYGMAKA